GNVIGGGDFATDRIIPDCIRAVEVGKSIIVRNPYSTRPYQHVLEPVAAYLMIAQAQYENRNLAGCYNVGPDDTDCWTTGRLVTLFCEEWKKQTGQEAVWENQYDGGPHEANFLKLDCSKIKSTFGWKPRWNVPHTMEKIVEWSKCFLTGGDVDACMERQIREFYREKETD
ncbi:MAG: GDP-mannose 4,6-dehydratase, partial [Lachnospiraceae bacterium]|nr:GDP-mannose 4,6-dehydratase [Lachnospiraceae bacterium]